MRQKHILLAMCLLAPLGCKRAATVTTYPVAGRVTVGKKPLEGATVNFTNKNVDGFSASGKTDADGRFRLTTYVNPREFYGGAMPGEYTVLITKPAPGETQTDEMSKMANATPEERNALMIKRMEAFRDREASNKEKPKSEVPEKYSTPDSPLSATIVIGENPPLEWDLTE